jgi:hypothetical protein
MGLSQESKARKKGISVSWGKRIVCLYRNGFRPFDGLKKGFAGSQMRQGQVVKERFE